MKYALQGIHGLLEYEAGWNGVEPSLIDRILTILCSNAQPNVLRPATAIVRDFVVSQPGSSGHETTNAYKTPLQPSRRNAPTFKGKERADPGTGMGMQSGDKRFGFDAIWRRMESVGAGLEGEGNEMERIWGVVVRRLEGTGDLELVAQR